MKIFVAGASGALGKRLVPMLVSRGHSVVGTTRKPERMAALRQAGAEMALLNALDREAVLKTVAAARPEVVVHQMTSLAEMRDFRRFDEEMRITNQLRTEGTEYLMEAAMAVGARRFVAQSYTGWPNAREGSRVKTEEDTLDAHPPASMAGTLEAIRRLESMVTGAPDVTGVALRYGGFYGPGTSIAEGADVVEMVRKRRFPVVGGGRGVWSFIHIDDAAAATVLAIESEARGVFNIVDDEPAEVAVWLPELARAIGAKPPYRVPGWLGRLLIGEAGVLMMTQIRGSSNAKAKRVLGWEPEFASWREGFRRGLAGEQGGVRSAAIAR